jgi:hypothetical protein
MTPSDTQSGGLHETFLLGAYRRIQIALSVSVAMVSCSALALYGPREGLGVLLGGGVAFINFLWLKRSMMALTNAVSAAEQAPPKPTLVLRFFLRYALLAAIGYVMINNSAISAYGVMWGLLLSVPALLFEVICEIWYALKHGE